jgi:hypothetical protein
MIENRKQSGERKIRRSGLPDISYFHEIPLPEQILCAILYMIRLAVGQLFHEKRTQPEIVIENKHQVGAQPWRQHSPVSTGKVLR